MNRDAYGRFTFKNAPIYHRGYPVVYMPDHHRARSNGYVREHILIAEKLLGRCLAEGEVIHHINGDKTDNRAENLMVFRNHGDHMRFHWHLRDPDKYKGDIPMVKLQEAI